MGKTTFKGDILVNPRGDETDELVTTAVLVKVIDNVTEAAYATPVKVFELPPYSAIIDIVVNKTGVFNTGTMTVASTSGGTDIVNARTLGGVAAQSMATAITSTTEVNSWMNSGSTKKDIYLTIAEAASAGVASVYFLFAPGINDPSRAQGA